MTVLNLSAVRLTKKAAAIQALGEALHCTTERAIRQGQLDLRGALLCSIKLTAMIISRIDTHAINPTLRESIIEHLEREVDELLLRQWEKEGNHEKTTDIPASTN